MRESDVQAWVNSIPDINSSTVETVPQYLGSGSRITNDFKEALKGRLEIVYALNLAKKLKDQSPGHDDGGHKSTDFNHASHGHRKIVRTAKVTSGGPAIQSIKL